MVDHAQPVFRDQHNGQPQGLRQIGIEPVFSQRRIEPARAFHEQEIPSLDPMQAALL
jgi:hypothetical protein